MKKFIGLFFILILLNSSVLARGAGYHYVDGGYIFSNVTVPQSLPGASYINQNNIRIQSRRFLFLMRQKTGWLI